MDLFKVQLEKDDVILVEINLEEIDLDTAHQQFQTIQDAFPYNEVIAYIKGTKLHFCKEKHIDYIGKWPE